MFTYRDERRLLAMISVVIIAALVALIQILAARTGTISPITAAGTSLAAGFQIATTAIANGVRGTLRAARDVPHLERDVAALTAANARLRQENARLAEANNAYRQQGALAPELRAYPKAIEARVIAYPPEDTMQGITIDRGTRSGINRNDGVLAAGGVVGRIIEAAPFTSKVQLITDYASTIPAVLQRGRYWGEARGNRTSVRLEYLSQDAVLHVGDTVVTGEARSFHSGEPIGTIVGVEKNGSQLFQNAIVQPAVDPGTLDRVIVVPK